MVARSQGAPRGAFLLIVLRELDIFVSPGITVRLKLNIFSTWWSQL